MNQEEADNEEGEDANELEKSLIEEEGEDIDCDEDENIIPGKLRNKLHKNKQEED